MAVRFTAATTIFMAPTFESLQGPLLQSFAHFGDELYSKEELVAEVGAALRIP